MQAVLHRRYGPAREVLEDVSNWETAIPGDHDLIVRNFATSVNPIDCAVRSGYGAAYFEKVGIVHRPHVPGRDVAGEVVAVGAKVVSFKPGDRIWAGVLWGASAEHVVVPDDWAAPLPRSTNWQAAAAFPFAGLTAWTALVTHAGLNAGNARGKRVIVPRGAGGVGSYAIQILKSWGAQVATIVSARNVALVTELGADVIVDYSKQDFADVLHDYDVAFDTSFDTEERLLNALKVGADAVYVSVVTPKLTLIDKLGLAPGLEAGDKLFAERVSVQRALGRRYAWSFMQPSGAALCEVAALFDSGLVRSVIDSVYPLNQLAAAHERCERGVARGKIVVTIAEGSKP